MMRSRLLFVSLFALPLVGCGGSSGGDSSPNPFAGIYAGEFSVNAGENQGRLLGVSISDGGQFRGTYANLTTNRTGPITGRIAENGDLNASFTLADGTRGTISGRLGFDGAGLTGNLAQTVGGETDPFVPNLSRRGASPFAGSYTGSYTQDGLTATLDATVSESGAVTGKISGEFGGFPRTAELEGGIGSDGFLSGVVSADEGSVVGSGTLTLEGDTLSGTLTQYVDGVASGSIVISATRR